MQARGLRKRCRGKGESIARTKVGVGMETRTETKMEMRAKERTTVEQVPNIYVVEINKSRCKEKSKGNTRT
jgi:hypothetical protein